MKKLEKDVVDMKTGQKIKATQARKEAQPTMRPEKPHALNPIDELKYHSRQAHGHMEEARNLIDPSTLGAYQGPRSPFSEGYKPLAGHEDRFQAHKERYQHHSDAADAAHEKVSARERAFDDRAAQHLPDAPKARTTPSQQFWGKNKTPDGSSAKIRAALDRQAEAKPDLGKSLEKAATGHEKSVHKPIAGGGSSAGRNVEYANEVKKDPSLAHYKSPEGTIDDSYADAKRKHKKVLSEMKAMPKPDLGKSGEGSGVHTTTDRKGISPAGQNLRTLDHHNKANPSYAKKKMESDVKGHHKEKLAELKAMPKPDLGKSGDLEKSLTTPAHSAHGKLAAMLNKLRGTSLDKSEDDQDPASAHLAEIVQTLDDCLRSCSDEQTQEKISLAKDYLSTLMAHLQYEPEMHSALTDLMHNGPESQGE